MECSIQEDKIEVVLSFKREELLYDIKNYAYIEGHMMPPEAEHSKHMVTDVGEEGNVDRITRLLDLEISKVREMLYPYTKHEVAKTVYDDKFKERKQYGIVMKVPTGVSQTTLTLIERLIHEYLVYKAVAEWLSITNQKKAEAWIYKAEACAKDIRVALNTRMKRTRIRTHWI